MKTKFLAVSLALTALLLAGCQGNEQAAGTGSPAPEQTESTAPEQSVPASPEPSGEDTPAPSEGGAESIFTPGTWLAGSGGEYFYFYKNGNQGGTCRWEDGMGTAFAYEYADGRAMFHMAANDNNTPCTVEVTDAEHITLRWDDGHTTELTYQGAGEIGFYSNWELCDLAVAYYKQASGIDSENLTAGAVTGEGGTVTIQVYENLGDHNSTAAWYTVDRFTGQGTDVNTGEAVDLSSAGA